MTGTQDARAHEEAQDGTAEEQAANGGEAPAGHGAPQPGRLALWTLGVAALASLGGVLYSLHRKTGMADGIDETGVMLLALSLFSPIIVTVFAGAVAALIAPRLVKGPQKAVALLAGLAAGLIAGGAAYAAYSVDGAIALALGFLLLGSGLVGGIIGMSKRTAVVAAGLSAALLLLLVMFTRGVLEASSSLSLFSDPLDQYNALGTAVPFIAGIAGGICSFVYLRQKRSGAKLLGHLLAGALAGALWLIATVIAQIGVEVVLGIGLDEVAPLDSAFLTLSFQSQYNGSMTAMFAGALCAVLAYGMLIPKAAQPKARKRS